jgi:hypothetical protein
MDENNEMTMVESLDTMWKVINDLKGGIMNGHLEKLLVVVVLDGINSNLESLKKREAEREMERLFATLRSSNEIKTLKKLLPKKARKAKKAKKA